MARVFVSGFTDGLNRLTVETLFDPEYEVVGHVAPKARSGMAVNDGKVK